jgi:hypothetical protein
MWTDQTPKALEILEPLADRPVEELGPAASVVYLNLAEARERAGFYAKAIAAAKRGHELSGRRPPHHEEARLVRLEYKRRMESEPNWAKDNMAEVEYTFGWRNKKLPPVAFHGFNPNNGVDSEMRKQIYSIRASPDYADAWMALGMLVEKKSNKATLVTSYRLYERAAQLGHPMTGEIKVHLRALQPFLPAGYSFASAAWITLKRTLVILFIGFSLVYASRFTGQTSWKGFERLRERLAARRERKWRPDRWEDHHIESLERELDTRLEDEAPSPGKINGNGGRKAK